MTLDIVTDELGRKRFREHHQRRLRHVLDRLVPQRLSGADRGAVQNDAAAPRELTTAMSCKSQKACHFSFGTSITVSLLPATALLKNHIHMDLSSH